MSAAVSSIVEIAVAPCTACSHAENHHLGCRLHDACCGADGCGCLGFQPGPAAATTDAWDIALGWDAHPATRREIEYVAAWLAFDADELEALVRAEERRAREPM